VLGSQPLHLLPGLKHELGGFDMVAVLGLDIFIFIHEAESLVINVFISRIYMDATQVSVFIIVHIVLGRQRQASNTFLL